MKKNKSVLSNPSSFVDPLKELIADNLEVIADTQLDEGILKDLPIAGSFLKLYKAYSNIKDRILIKKINRFLSELESISTNDKDKFWVKYEDSEEEKQKLGEQLIIYLDRCDTISKATLLARAFGAYITGRINKTDFLDLATIIDSIQVHHLEAIASILVLAGSGGSSFYRVIDVDIDWKRFIPGMESQRLLEYEDETKMIDDRYNGPSIKTERKHRGTSLGQILLNFVVPEIYTKVSASIGEFYAERLRVQQASFARERKT